MSMTRQQLEAAAIAAHAVGGTWTEFWAQHADEVHALEPSSLGRHCQLVCRLTALVTSGDLHPVPLDSGWERPCDWELDDVTTAARCLWTPEVTR
jgi:hypothetical protein